MSNKKQSNNDITVFDNNKKIPKYWKLVKIEKCCEILDSKRIPLNSQERKRKQGNIPYYGANGIQDHINQHIFDDELILLAEDGGNFLEFQTKPIAYMIQGKSWVNNHAHVLKNRSNYDLKFIFYSLVHKNIIPWINGTTRSKLNQSELREIKIPIPRLKEQQEIAIFLSNIDILLHEVQKELEFTKILKKEIMEKLLVSGVDHSKFKKVTDNFNQEFEIPDNWKLLSFKEISQINPKSIGNDYSYKKINYIDIGSIENFQIKHLIEFSTSKRPSRAQRITQKGDILVSTVRPYLQGFSLVENNESNLICSTGFTVIRSNNSNLTTFLFNFIKSSFFKNYVVRLVTGLAYPAITSKIVEKCLIPIPTDKEELYLISKTFSDIDLQIQFHIQYKKRLEILKRGLMQKLLTGKIRVSSTQ